MKPRIILQISFACLAAVMAPARAQREVSVGGGLAHDCYMTAKAGDRPEAGIAICDGALQFETLTGKNLAATYDNRGVMKSALGQIDRALADFNRSIEIDRTLGDAYVNRGSVFIKKRQYQTALADINKGLALGVSFPQVGYYDRAIIEEAMDQPKEAYDDYKRVLDLEPNFTAATEMLKLYGNCVQCGAK